MSARNEDFLFAQEAQSLGYVSEEQVEEGFLLQKRMAEDLKIDERLSVILVKRGWMAEEQAKRVTGIVEPAGSRSQIEGYRLVQMVGRGAMGTVYKAIHKGLHRVVAVKILRRDLAKDKTQVERLKREAKLLADLDHPNIVRAFDAGESNGFPFLVMEYVEGETLRDRINREGALSDEEALRITRALADALERARRMGVVHRDVKPGNVLMSTSGTPKLMDLGLAKGPLDMGLTQHGATVGTPQFISPEQAQDPRKADTRSDIYSLGASLYAMVTTRPPFEGATLAEIITKVLYQQPVPPRIRNPNVSPEVAHLIERMMLKDPTLRYQTPAQVIADIDMVRGGQSIMPKGFQGNWEAFLLRQQQKKRQRLLVAGAIVLLLAGLGGFWFFNRHQREMAQRRVETLASEALALPGVGPDDVLGGPDGLTARLVEAEDLHREIVRIEREEGVHCEEEPLVLDRVNVYKANKAQLEALANVAPTVDEALARADFRRALEPLTSFLKRDGLGLPALRAAKAQVADIRARSDAHWQAAVKAVDAIAFSTLDDFVSRFGAARQVLDGGYIDTVAYREAVERQQRLADAAATVRAEVQGVADRFLGSAIEERIRGLQFFGIVTEFQASERDALSAVGGQHTPFQALFDRARINGPRGVATVALQRIRDRMDQQVDDSWHTLREQIEDGMAVDTALDRLDKFIVACEQGNVYPRLAQEAQRLLQRLDREKSDRILAAKAAFQQTRDAVLRHLRAGRPRALEQELDDARDNRPLDTRRKEALEGLRSGVTALDALRGGAMDLLETRKELTKVERRSADGGPVVIRRLTDVRLDRPAQTLHGRARPKGTRPFDVAIPLRDFTLRQLNAWAAATGKPLAGVSAEVVHFAMLAPVHDDPGEDLRKLKKAYAEQLARMEGLAEGAAWVALVRDMHDALRGHQASRETDARLLIESAWQKYVQQKYVVALGMIEEALDPGGKVRYTDEFDKNASRLEQWAARCREALDQEKLLRMLPGGIVDPLEGERHRVRFDFDDEAQLENFPRCFGVLEAFEGKAVTPSGSIARRLHLLKGVEGLVRDRPLSMPTPFDPHDRITVQFTMYSMRSFMLAVDIDGVQVAICSADPNYWKWRFHPDTPLMDGESKLPEYDFGGRGRGIAFHAGPDFGPEFPLGNWDWSSLGAGRNFERFADREWLAKRRARLFAFEPGRKYEVKVVRTRGEIQLWIDGDEIARKVDPGWTHKGKKSELDPKLTRGGSGRIQILTWTPMGLDDLILEGRVMDSWREAMTAKLGASKQEPKKEPK